MGPCLPLTEKGFVGAGDPIRGKCALLAEGVHLHTWWGHRGHRQDRRSGAIPAELGLFWEGNDSALRALIGRRWEGKTQDMDLKNTGMCESRGCESWEWPGDVGESLFQGSPGNHKSTAVSGGCDCSKVLEPAQEPVPQICCWDWSYGLGALGLQEPLGAVPCRDVKRNLLLPMEVKISCFGIQFRSREWLLRVRKSLVQVSEKGWGRIVEYPEWEGS